MQVRIACQGAIELPLADLQDFQGELKSLSKTNYAKLKKEILELGFSEPFSVWKSPQGYKLLNGHQRRRALTAMASEHVSMPDKFPCSIIDAATEAEARRKVLALTSQYGVIEKQGLYEFMHESNIGLTEVSDSFRFPDIDLEDFADEYFQTDTGKNQEGEVEFSQFIGESNNYVVLVFKNDVDWLAAQTHFGIEGKYATRKNGKDAWSKGLGKVIDGASYLTKIHKSESGE